MSLISNMITKAVGSALPFVNDNPAAAITQIAGYAAGQTPRTAARGPLADLYNSQTKRETFQYPENIGTGPFQNWIVFNVLKSVATAGPGSTPFSQLNGVSNSLFAGGPGAQGVSLLTGAIEKTISGSVVESALNTVGISNMKLFSAKRKVVATSTTIALYIPNTIVFGQKNEYTDMSLTDQLGLVLGASQLSQATQGGSNLGTGAPFALEAGARAISGAFGGGDDMRDMILMNTGGVALNPQIEVIFRKTEMRRFQFDFMMAARSRTEMQSIHNIVNQFRSAAAPSFAAGGGGRYLIPPSEFDIQFKFSGADSIMIPKISTCVITDVICDYAPSGQYAVFGSDGRPVNVRLQLSFEEVDLITKDKTMQGY
jgi:hypothetical protein